LKVAVFARALTRRPTGRGTYVAEMIRALAAGGDVELDVFAGEPVDLPRCRFWPARGRTVPGSAWRVLHGIGRDLRRISPDVLWSATHFLPRGLPRGLPTVATLLDVVWRDHPETMSRGNRWAASWLEEGLQRADRIACISEFTRGRLAAHWPGLESRAKAIPLAPNPRLQGYPADPALLARLGLDRPFVLTVGTLEPRKNLGLVLDAMALLPGVPLVHCGPAGWDMAALQERARRQPDVRLLGWVDETTLAALYRSAAAAVFPSLYEGFDLPALDAASLGCPLVVSDIAVHREVLGEAPIYFPLGGAEAAARGLRDVLESSEMRRDLSGRAKSRASTYTWEASARRLRGLFSQAWRRSSATA
jgi:glycosyltransferase involved in cell wall biosynthesis